MKFRVYRNSLLATLISIFGIVFKIPVVFIVFYVVSSKEYLLLLLVPVFGLLSVAVDKLSDYVSERKEIKKFIRTVKKAGLEESLAYNTELAVKLFRQLPCKQVMKYIAQFNPEAVNYIKSAAN